MNTKSTFKEVCSLAANIAQFEAKIKTKEIDQQFINNLKVWSAGIFKIVVMGEIKKGKSSLINSIIGVKDLAPTASDVATSTVFKICYGPEIKYKVFFFEDAQKSPIFISKDEISLYGTESGNPNNEKLVDFIQVFVPSPILKDGLVIIDTPGLGGLFKQHKRITYEYVPRADGVFLVCDSIESPIGLAEIELLNDLKKVTNNICVIQTKSNAVDSEARNARKTNNLKILNNAGFSSLKYFVVDSHLRFEADETKDIEDLNASGYPELMAFINNDVKTRIQDLIKSKIKTSLGPILDSIQKELSLTKSILLANSEKKREEIRLAIEQTTQDVINFQQNIQPEIQEIYQRGLRDVREYIDNQLMQLRPGGDVVNELERMINDTSSVEELNNSIGEIQNKMPEVYSHCIGVAQNFIKKKSSDIIEQISNKCTIKDVKTVLSCVSNQTQTDANLIKTLDFVEEGSMFETLRTSLYGGMAGVAIASIAGGIIGSVIPVIGTVIGSNLGFLVAGYWGSSEANKIKDQNDLKSAKSKTIMALSNSMTLTTNKIQKELQHIIEELGISLNSAIRKSITNTQNELLKKKNELTEQANLSAQEIANKKTELLKNENTYNSMLRALGNS